MKSQILITGGVGYIGSHTLIELLTSGYECVVLDNLVNSSVEAFNRALRIANCSAVFVEGDVQDRGLLDRVFAEYSIDAVLHFAGLKAVGESVSQPLRYYDTNVHGSQVLLQAMVAAGVFSFVFSSSATVYGEPAQMPISEACPVGQPTNPYGRSKLMVEDILRDLAASDQRWRIVSVRPTHLELSIPRLQHRVHHQLAWTHEHFTDQSSPVRSASRTIFQRVQAKPR